MNSWVPRVDDGLKGNALAFRRHRLSDLQRDELWSKREMIHRRMEELVNEKKAADAMVESSSKERQGLLGKLKDLEVG